MNECSIRCFLINSKLHLGYAYLLINSNNTKDVSKGTFTRQTS